MVATREPFLLLLLSLGGGRTPTLHETLIGLGFGARLGLGLLSMARRAASRLRLELGLGFVLKGPAGLIRLGF